MNKRIRFSFVLFLLILCSGCWSRTEVEELAIVTAIGIDDIIYKGEEKLRFSMLIVKPDEMGDSAGGRGQGAPAWFGFAQGDTLFEAVENFSTTSSKKLFGGHVSSIILGESIARKGVSDVIDFVQRHKAHRLRNWVLVAEGSAQEALGIHPELRTLPSEELEGLLGLNANMTSKSYAVDLKSFLVDLAVPGKEAVLPVLEIREVGREIEHPGGEAAGDKSKHKNVSLKGLAVFKGDKMVGKLRDIETRGFLWVIGKAKGGILIASDPHQEEPHVAINMTRASSKIMPEVVDGKLIITVKIKAEGNLGEYGKAHGTTKPEDIERIEKSYAAVIKNEAERAITKCQKVYNSDIFGFGAIVHRKQLKYWKEYKLEENWSEMFSDVPIRVEVEAKIRRTGMIGDSLKIK